MSSVLDTLTSIDKIAIVIDIGEAYTKFGFAGEIAPRYIIPTRVTIDEENKSIFNCSLNSMIVDKDRLKQLLQLIFYQYNIINCKNRRIVIIDCVVTPTHIRRLLADILLKQFEVLSLLFIPSHLVATYTLGRNTALVLDIGYREAQILPIVECVPLAINFDSLFHASQAIHQHIQVLLEEHALIIQDGKKRAFRTENLKLSENVLEDIKVRTCFVSSYSRSQNFARLSDFSFKQASFVDYVLNSDIIIRIPGIVREFACEILFQEDINGRSLMSLILDSIIKSPIDCRRELANNILVIGGTAMMPGFLHRLNAELIELVKTSSYINRLGIKQFHFHSPPAQLNYTAWLGGSLFGTLDKLDSQSIIREKYLQNGFLPDWFTSKQQHI